MELEFTRKERAVIRRCRTPAQVQMYLFDLGYNNEPNTLRSFRGVARTGQAHCFEAALTSAAILEQHGYPPIMADILSWDNLDHVVHLYQSRRTGLWGCVAKSRDPGLHGRRAVFRTVRDLVWSYFDPFIDFTGRIISYGVGDLRALGDYEWRISEKNVWKVDRYCDTLTHRKIRSSDRRYKYWYRRFVEFKKAHPDRRPTYFNDKENWLPGYGKRRW